MNLNFLRKTLCLLVLLLSTFLPGGCIKPVTNPMYSTISDTATPTPSFTQTATPTATLNGWDVTTAFVSIGGGTYNYDYIRIHPGVRLWIDGPTTFNVTRYFSMDSAACTIDGLHWDGNAGAPSSSSNAGAGHIGAGGADGRGNNGGPVYDDASNPSFSGSFGGAGACESQGRPGGNLIKIIVTNGPATLNGIIDMNGQESFSCGPSENSLPAGAGSGGAIIIQADQISGNGQLLASGGTGIADDNDTSMNSGGGGGGVVILSHHTTDNFTGTILVSGGNAVSPASAGSNGSYSRTSY